MRRKTVNRDGTYCGEWIEAGIIIKKDGGIKMQCRKCGSQLNDGAKFCNICGAQVQSEQSGSSSETGRGQQIPGVVQDRFLIESNKWYLIRIIGLFLMFISVWMKWASVALPQDGNWDFFDGSLWEFYIQETKVSFVLYAGLACMVLSAVFAVLKKNLVSVIFAVIGGFPSYAVIGKLIGSQYAGIYKGVYIAILGWVLIIMSIIMMRISRIIVQSIEKEDGMEVSDAIGKRYLNLSVILGIIGLVTYIVPVGFSTSIAGMIIGIMGIKKTQNRTVIRIIEGIVSIILCGIFVIGSILLLITGRYYLMCGLFVIYGIAVSIMLIE